MKEKSIPPPALRLKRQTFHWQSYLSGRSNHCTFKANQQNKQPEIIQKILFFYYFSTTKELTSCINQPDTEQNMQHAFE